MYARRVQEKAQVLKTWLAIVRIEHVHPTDARAQQLSLLLPLILVEAGFLKNAETESAICRLLHPEQEVGVAANALSLSKCSALPPECTQRIDERLAHEGTKLLTVTDQVGLDMSAGYRHITRIGA